MTAVYDFVVAGGGPAGAAFAWQLAQAGRCVLLVEKEAGPHDKICGEFLSGEALHYLAQLGVDPVALGGIPITHLILSRQGRSVGCVLPFSALTLSRRRLDAALLERARSAGVEIRQGVAVQNFSRAQEDWTVRLTGGSVRASNVALATGKHDMRGRSRQRRGTQADLIGFKLHLQIAPDQHRALAGAVELCLFPGGYAGLQNVEGGLTNLCLLVDKTAYNRRGSWAAFCQALLKSSPQLAQRLKGARPCDERPLATAAIPYGFVQADAEPDGCWRLGDQAAVIPSFAGAGISLALHSASLASEAVLQGASVEQFQVRFAADARRRVRASTMLSRLMVKDASQAVLETAAHVFPSSLRIIASLTRLPAAKLRSGRVRMPGL